MLLSGMHAEFPQALPEALSGCCLVPAAVVLGYGNCGVGVWWLCAEMLPGPVPSNA